MNIIVALNFKKAYLHSMPTSRTYIETYINRPKIAKLPGRLQVDGASKENLDVNTGFGLNGQTLKLNCFAHSLA